MTERLRVSGGGRARPSPIDLRVAPRTALQEATDKLRNAITSGYFQPGERLVEADLREMLGVSRPLVREALRGLVAERLIEEVPNRGVAVAKLSWEDAKSIYDVREMLEGEAAALCSTRVTSEEIEEMADALKAFQRALSRSDSEGLLLSTARFYEVLLTASGNRIIKEIISQLFARINWLRQQSMSLPGRAARSLVELEAILDAIGSGNARAARSKARQHVAEARKAAEIVHLMNENRENS